MYTSSRQDLSEWAIHFIHDRNPENQPDDEVIRYNSYRGFPYHENRDLNSRFSSWDIVDEKADLAPDDSAFSVLLKVIRDGHIRTTWAFRKSRPTVYGPRAAVCFTEMPLYGLVDYAKHRQDEVGTYAIGLLKYELFTAGGRPVIYGLSGRHAEQQLGVPGSRCWPRKLHASCGLAEGEQYRYVAMAMDRETPIDWSHEREWRWVDHEDRCSCPGLPVWLADEPISFGRIFVVVPTVSEMERVLDLLKELYDAGGTDYGYVFRKSALEKTSVVALERVQKQSTETHVELLRLEDIPKSEIETFRYPKASPEFTKKVSSVIAEAQRAADKAAGDFLETASRTKDGHVADVAGWAHLTVGGAQTRLVSALLHLKAIQAVPGEGYYFRNLGGLGWGNEQALSVAEAAVKAARAVLERHFPGDQFGSRTRWD